MTAGLLLALGATAALGGWALWLRRRLREARAAASRFRGLVEAADDIIFRTDAEGRFTYVNPAAVEVLGYAEEELARPRGFLDVVRADYREQARRFYEDQRQQGIPNTLLRVPDGDARRRGRSGSASACSS